MQACAVLRVVSDAPSLILTPQAQDMMTKLMVKSIEEVLEHAETVVIGNGDTAFSAVLDRLTDNQVLVDLVRITPEKSQDGQYDGICW